MNEREIRKLVLVIVAALFLSIGVLFGKTTAIHNCYMVSENDSTYVLNFNGTEHLYLKGDK